MNDRLTLVERKEQLAQQLDSDNVKMLDAYVMKDVLGLTNDEVANIAGKSRPTLQRLLKEPVASEYVEVSQQIRELDKEQLGAEAEEVDILQAFASIKQVLLTKALAGEAKAIDLLLKHHSVLTSIEEQQAKKQQAWEATQSNVQKLIDELDAESKYSLTLQGYRYAEAPTTADTPQEAPQEPIRDFIEFLDCLHKTVEETPQDALHSEYRHAVKRFYFGLTSIVKPLLQGYGVNAEKITRV